MMKKYLLSLSFVFASMALFGQFVITGSPANGGNGGYAPVLTLNIEVDICDGSKIQDYQDLTIVFTIDKNVVATSSFSDWWSTPKSKSCSSYFGEAYMGLGAYCLGPGQPFVVEYYFTNTPLVIPSGSINYACPNY